MPGGGIYGMWQSRGLLAYAIGFIVTIPFAVLPDIYTGPIAQMLGGVDIGWLVGLVVSGSVYALLSRSLDLKAEETAIAKSEADLKAMQVPVPAEASAVPVMDDVWK